MPHAACRQGWRLRLSNSLSIATYLSQLNNHLHCIQYFFSPKNRRTSFFCENGFTKKHGAGLFW